MSDIIQLLPDSVANQIAAGEVIQRPASVIKELVENAVDAEATIINVLVVDAGRTSIQVIDNGKGMSATDARLSFERHATSKIKSAADLFALHTMGFRGEALASIAAVAQVELRTRLQGEDVGTLVNIHGSRFVNQEPCSCPTGSNFKVENIFYNVPARRKFLKSNATELNTIITAFERIVLVYPHISFTLHSNGVEIFNLKAASLKQRIVDVFGKKLNQDLLPVNVETTVCSITGFIGKPASAKKKGAQQYFFVNNRYMRHPYFHKAVVTAYERLVATGEQVPYFIYFDVPAGEVDVNIHPTKTEIKFENEQTIWQILLAAVKDAVGLFSEIPQLDFEAAGQPDIPVYDPLRPSEQPQVKVNPQYNPFEQSPSYQRAAVPKNWEDLYDNLTQHQPMEQSCLDAAPDDVPVSEKAVNHYQFKGKYIITSVQSGLMIIDQHRAHIRILYEKYMQQMSEKSGQKQRLLFPDVIHLSATGMNILGQIEQSLADLGFELSDLGHGDFAINTVPTGLEGMNIVTLLDDIITTTSENETFTAESIHASIATGLARNAAIPYGQVMNESEMESLINDLFACKNPNYTPEGKKTVAIWAQQDMDKLMS